MTPPDLIEAAEAHRKYLVSLGFESPIVIACDVNPKLTEPLRVAEINTWITQEAEKRERADRARRKP